MITLESIKQKLGFNPLTYDFAPKDKWLIDDNDPHLFDPLSIDELNFLIALSEKKYCDKLHRRASG